MCDNVIFVCWTGGFNQQDALAYLYQRFMVVKMIPQRTLQIRKEQYTIDQCTAERSVLNLGYKILIDSKDEALTIPDRPQTFF